MHDYQISVLIYNPFTSFKVDTAMYSYMAVNDEHALNMLERDFCDQYRKNKPYELRRDYVITEITKV